MVVEHSVGSSNDCLPVSPGIPRHADARLNIVLVSLNAFLQAQHIVCRKREPLRWFELRRNLDVIAHAVIQSDGWG